MHCSHPFSKHTRRGYFPTRARRRGLWRTTFVHAEERSHTPEYLVRTLLNMSCIEFCDPSSLSPEQRRARRRFEKLFSQAPDLPIGELMTQLMRELDEFFFFGLLTQHPGVQSWTVEVIERPVLKIDDRAVSGRAVSSAHAIAIFEKLWRGGAPQCLDHMVVTLIHEMVHAYFQTFYSTRLSSPDEVQNNRGHGTAFHRLNEGILVTVRSWHPCFARIASSTIPALLTETPQLDAYVLVERKLVQVKYLYWPPSITHYYELTGPSHLGTFHMPYASDVARSPPFPSALPAMRSEPVDPPHSTAKVEKHERRSRFQAVRRITALLRHSFDVCFTNRRNPARF